MLEPVSFMMSFAAAPYALSAAALTLLIRRARSTKQLVLISLIAPLIMWVLQGAFLAAIDPPELRSASRLVQLFGPELIAVVIPWAAAFVLLAWLGYALGRRLQLIRSAEQPNKSLERSRER
jgi:hypothetical protein